MIKWNLRVLASSGPDGRPLVHELKRRSPMQRSKEFGERPGQKVRADGGHKCQKARDAVMIFKRGAAILSASQHVYALRISGYHNECEVEGEWVAADATFAPGRCFLAYSEAGASQVIVATSLQNVARAFAEEGHVPLSGVVLPTGAVNAFLVGVPDLHAAVRRLFELSRSLPSAPLDRFQEKTRALPKTTEVERLVVQRVGQDIFREALMDFWSGRCAGLDQPELLRASHMKPRADCASDAERLDPFNGLLLAIHWDAWGPNRGTAGQLGPPDAGVSFTGLPSANLETRITRRSFQPAERISSKGNDGRRNLANCRAW
jgi:hypothetical protein